MQRGELCCEPGIKRNLCPQNGRHQDCHQNDVCQDDDGDGDWHCKCVQGFYMNHERKCVTCNEFSSI